MKLTEIIKLIILILRHKTETIMPKEGYEAEWKYWDGWSSKCGYKHSTVRGNPNLLQDYCPCCKSKMKKQ